MSVDSTPAGGHLFVIEGDITRLACDAWLLPTDEIFNVTAGWWGVDALAPLLTRHHARRDTDPHGNRLFQDGRGSVWLRDDDDPTGPRIYATDVGGGGTRQERYARAARAFIDAALAEAPETPRGGRARRLLALPAVGTGEGGGEAIAGSVLIKLVATLAEAARTRDVDLVLVCRRPGHFAAAQAARRQVDPEGAQLFRDLDAKTRGQAEKLARLASHGQLVLFVGAGVSRGAGLPDWESLLGQLARRLGLDDATRAAYDALPALDKAQYIAERTRSPAGGPTVGQHVSALLRAHAHHGLGHALLADLPVNEVITTNYDTLFETAVNGTQRPEVRVLPYTPAGTGSRWLLKMHGCVTHPEDIVLTREDYIRYVERNAALAGIVQAMLMTKKLLFVGFSFSDDNFHRIVDAVRRAVRGGRGVETQDPSAAHLGYALMLQDRPLMRTLWDRDLPWICPPADVAGSPAQARWVEIFLDLLAYHTASNAHLLDPRLSAVLSADERLLADRLRGLAADAERFKGLPAWAAVEELLVRLGWRARG